MPVVRASHNASRKHALVRVAPVSLNTQEDCAVERTMRAPSGVRFTHRAVRALRPSPCTGSGDDAARAVRAMPNVGRGTAVPVRVQANGSAIIHSASSPGDVR